MTEGKAIPHGRVVKKDGRLGTDTRALSRNYKSRAKCPKCEVFHEVATGAKPNKLIYEYCPRCRQTVYDSSF